MLDRCKDAVLMGDDLVPWKQAFEATSLPGPPPAGYPVWCRQLIDLVKDECPKSYEKFSEEPLSSPSLVHPAPRRAPVCHRPFRFGASVPSSSSSMGACPCSAHMPTCVLWAGGV